MTGMNRKSKFTIRNSGAATDIVLEASNPELPLILGRVAPLPGGCNAEVWLGNECVPIVSLNFLRGKAFGVQATRGLMLGVLSRVGKKRRMTENRRIAKASSEIKSKILKAKGVFKQ